MISKKIMSSVLLLIVFFSSAYSQPREIYIEGNDQLRFSVETITAAPGESLKITLKTISSLDKSQMAHNWVLLKQETDALNFVKKGLAFEKNDFIDPALEDKIISKTDMLGGGEEDSVTFTVPEKEGTYEYICTFRAHYQAGMKGQLIVK